MIDVDAIFQSVRDLILKGKGGYMTNAEFNRHLKNANVALFEFYFDKYETSQRFPEALRQFIVPVVSSLSPTGAAALPDNFVHVLGVQFRNVINVPGSEPVISLIPALPIAASEVSLTISSPIRKPSVTHKRIYFRILSGEIQLYTGANYGEVAYEYLRRPTDPSRAVTLDVVNDQENYAIGASIQLEFLPNQFENIRDLVLLQYGVQVRENEVVQWVSSRNAINQTISSI